jgi:hypothetical protein
MRRIFLAALMAFTILGMVGCGSDNPPPRTIVTQILSDPAFDGDIARTVGGTFTIAQGNTQNLFAGIDPATGEESRAFLDFPLTGAGGVPGNAVIVSATLDLFVNSIQSTPSTIPMRLELVSFTSILRAADFDSVPLTTTVHTFSFFKSDVGNHVTVDVTALMAEAQRLGLANFQIRLLEDFGPVTPGLIEINDTTGPNEGVLAPQLEVTYF